MRNSFRAALKRGIPSLACVLIMRFPVAGLATEQVEEAKLATVMTCNIYQGTELEHVLAATDLNSFYRGGFHRLCQCHRHQFSRTGASHC
jgi:hypothetical protein